MPFTPVWSFFAGYHLAAQEIKVTIKAGKVCPMTKAIRSLGRLCFGALVLLTIALPARAGDKEKVPDKIGNRGIGFNFYSLQKTTADG
jgi:hypothetical protein